MIFDDAVVNDRDAINRVRMRVLLVWTAMGCPARVANANATSEWFTGKSILEIPELSDCAPPRQETSLQRGNTG
jgi:hypothetical protein